MPSVAIMADDDVPPVVPLAAPSPWVPSGVIAPPAPPLPPAPPSAFAVANAEFWAARLRDVPRSALVLVALTGVAGGAFLVGQRPGLGAAVVGVLAWAAAVPAMVGRRAFGDLATALLSVALFAVVAVSDAGWLVALCIAAAVGLGAVAATSSRTAPAIIGSGLSWLVGALRGVPWVARSGRGLAGSRRDSVMVALRSVAITVLLLVVFGMLFASADAIFANYLPRLDLDLLPARVAVGILVAIVAVSLAHLALAPPGWSGIPLPLARPARRSEWLLPVLALDALVLAFVAVQVSALLGGHRHVLQTEGLTYAEYAREGFAQLVVVTALTLVVVAIAARRAPRGTARDRSVSRVALATLCIGTLGVVASALSRMGLYVEAFGLTRLRVFVVMTEIVLGVVLVLVMAAGVRWRGRWLPRAVVQVAGVAMLALALINPDALILRYNTAADLDIPLDISYLRGLSADAVPAMDRLDEPLRSCVLQWQEVEPADGPADWNLARDRAWRAMSAGDPVDRAGTPCYSLYGNEAP